MRRPGMQLSLVVLGLAALVSGCEKTCKSGTVLVEIKLSGGPLAATTIELDLQIGDDNPTAQPVTHTPDVASGTVEVQFPRGYPKGQTLTIGGRALLGPAVLGTGATSVKLGDECERVTIEITGEVVDLAGLDLSSGDMAFKVVKHGDRCDGVKGVGKTAPARGRRHELRHALRAGAAHRRRVEAALLPDQPGEEIDRQIVFRRCGREGLTDPVDSGRNARRRRLWGLPGFDRTALLGFTCARLRDAATRLRARWFHRLRVRQRRPGLAGEGGRHGT